jgi:hypothetical protein
VFALEAPLSSAITSASRAAGVDDPDGAGPTILALLEADAALDATADALAVALLEL